MNRFPLLCGFAAVFLLLFANGTIRAQATFSYTGSVQTYTVPVGATQIIVDAYGAAGFGLEGYGGRVQATHPVTPGEVLNIYVGGQGSETAGGFNGGGNPGSNIGYAGGGGASDIRRGGNALTDRIIVAGGGGGSGSNCGTWTAEGGHGGGLIGGSGCVFSCSDCQYTGSGGTQVSGGIAGPTGHVSCPGNSNGGFGFGGSNTVAGYGTGGGGGYYGGGSGCYEGAGGGSSYTSPLATSVTHTQGVRLGNGEITIIPVVTSSPCATPTSVTSSPATICQGFSANLNATSSGNSISWYTVPSGGAPIGTSLSGANFGVAPGSTATYYAEAVGISGGPGSQTFNYTGGLQTFTVPVGVTAVTLDARGAQGENQFPGGAGGLGGRVTGTLAVTPGQTLYIYVGGQNGYNGGGTGGLNGNTFFGGPSIGNAGFGGGASDVRAGGTALGNRVIVGGGGGGAGHDGTWPSCQVAGPGGNGGFGGYLAGGTGGTASGTPCNCAGGGGGGTGGAQASGGAPGNYAGDPACLRVGWSAGTAGTLGLGGNGSTTFHNGTGGGGGGGGGYYGGGAGGSGSDTTPGGGGGGGSSYIGGVSGGSFSNGFQSGNGQVIISWSGSACTASPRTAVTVTVSQNPTAANAGPNQTLCGTSTTLAANTPSTGSGTWSIVSGAGGSIATPSNPSSAFSGAANTTYTLRWTVANPPCASSTDDVLITLVGAPTTANAGPDQNLCASSATLAANTPTSGTGLWSIISGAGGTIATPTSAGSSFSGVQGTSYTLRWTTSNAPCAASTDDVIINFTTPTTPANAGPNEILCGTSTVLAANAPTSGVGSWTIMSGAGGSVAIPGSATSAFTGLANTTYTLRWVISNAPCPSTADDVVIGFVGPPTAANAGPDQVLCATSTTLAANAPSSGTGAWSIVSGAGGTIATPSSPTSGFSGSTGVLYVLRWTTSNPPCASSTDDVQIYFTPTTTVANAGPNQNLCGTSTFLAGNTATNGTGNWSIISGSGGTLVTPGSETSQFTGNPNTTYTLRWTIANSPCPSTTDDVVITLTGAPTVANAGPDQNICGTSATLAGNNALSGTGTWSIVSGIGGTIITPGSATSGFTGVQGNTYTLRWTIANLPCTETADDVVLAFNGTAAIANAGPNQMLCGTTTTLAANTPTLGSGLWTIVSGTGGSIANPSSPTSPFTLLPGITYNLRWTITNPPCTPTSDDVLIFTDNLPPTIACPANMNATGIPGQCAGIANYTAPVGTDNCSGPTTVQTAGLASGATFPAGITTNTFTTTDAFGNTSSCSFNVTVVDNQLPTITCPSNIVTTVNPGTCNATVTFATPVGTDNCAGATTTQTSGLNSGSTFPRGNVLNTFRVTDAVGNVSTCTFTVTVNDNEAPAINCPSNIVVNAVLGTCNAVVTYTTPTGTDNCTGATTLRITGQNSGTSFPIGVTNNLFRVTDGAGNSTTCSFTVTVNDGEAPTVSCPANISVPNSPGMCAANVSFTTPVGVDNCSSTTTSLLAGLPSGGAFPVGTTTNTFAVSDVSSNSATCSFTVTVSDNQGPTAICQNIVLPLDSTGTALVTTTVVDNNSFDNCTSLTSTVTPTSFNCGNLGANTVVLTLTDQNGNTSTCSAVVTVTSSPVAVAIIADTTSCGFNVSCFAGSDGVATANGVGGCPGYTYQWSNGQSGATATGLGAGTHTVTVTDVNGGTIVSTVVLTSPPPFNITTTSSGSCEGFGSGSITATATGGNNCSNPTYQWSNGATTSTLTGLTPGIYNLTVTDAGGCTVSRSISISTLPTPLPTFTQSGNTLTSNQTWSSYQWLLGGSNILGATNSSFTAVQSGSYSLAVTDTNGCTGTSNADTLTFVGMADPSGQWMGLTIYPNPTRDEFKLRTEIPIGHALTVTVHDLYGKQIFSRSLSHLAFEAAFDIKGLAASTYLVEVTSQKGGRKVFRLVVE